MSVLVRIRNFSPKFHLSVSPKIKRRLKENSSTSSSTSPPESTYAHKKEFNEFLILHEQDIRDFLIKINEFLFDGNRDLNEELYSCLTESTIFLLTEYISKINSMCCLSRNRDLCLRLLLLSCYRIFLKFFIDIDRDSIDIFNDVCSQVVPERKDFLVHMNRYEAKILEKIGWCIGAYVRV